MTDQWAIDAADEVCSLIRDWYPSAKMSDTDKGIVASLIREHCAKADRRERIATAAMQGMLAFSHPEYDMGGVEEVVKDAVKAADALIAELDKESK